VVEDGQDLRSTSFRATLHYADEEAKFRLMTTSPHRDACWFIEGFDTADLKDAKALLDELNK
jgi:hypothetical protein